MVPNKEVTIPKKTERRLLGVLLLLFLALWAWNVRVMNRTSRVDPAQEQACLEASIYVAALSLDAELQETGRLPRSLDQLGVDREGITYLPRGSDYELVAQVADRTVTFQKGEDLTPYEAAFRSLIPGGAQP
jgi:hypothetical protein